ncbi:hypothetical protein ACHAXR_007772 [Thalassiosira sp. AJA248-18]
MLAQRALACTWLMMTITSSRFLVAAFTTPSVLQASYPSSRASSDVKCFMATMPKPKDKASSSSSSAASSPESAPADETSSSTIPPIRSTTNQRNSKLRQLKDRMWVRETLEDITAAEFASSLSVEDEEETSTATTPTSTATTSSKNNGVVTKKKKKKRKRAVDFDNILNKLDLRIEEMCVLSSPEIAKEMDQTCYVLNRMVDNDNDDDPIYENTCYSLAENMGMGNVVYTNEQRKALLKRLIGTRERLVNFIEGNNSEMEMEGEGGDGGGDSIDADDIDDIRSQLQPLEDNSVKNGSSTSSPTAATTTFDTSLYVRDDGTVDWDGALQDREALKKFGSAVWSRINGQDPETNSDGDEEGGGTGGGGGDDFHTPTKAVTAKIKETDAIREKRDLLNKLEDELDQMEAEHLKLLNSAITKGQAVANVNLATVNSTLRKQIRESSDLLETKQAQVTFQMLNYELERIYTYLEGELGNTAAKGYIPLQDRLNVAEFGLLESQMDSFHRQMELSGEGETNLDIDVLAVVSDQLVDFKRRLGIDYYVTGLTFDSEAIQVWSKDIWVKTKNGFTFYVKGTRLFVDDVVFCSSLILKALQGYTLKPREVRTLRRTFKDTITFIPVVIILLIPLTPIGHVLVFGAIQRVFPDFFPSCFTERRQNLLELYESTEYSAVTINETWTQKLVRLSQAIRILIIGLFNELYTSLGGAPEEKSDENRDNNQSS